jgi:energy-coupling factor transport system ATP-binding protein
VSEHRTAPWNAIATAHLDVDRGVVTTVAVPVARLTTNGAPSNEPAAQPAESVTLRGVTAGFFGRLVLADVDFVAGRGEVVALMGPNGGCKTTLLRVIAGLLRPLAGKVERRPGRVAYLPQNPAALLHRPTVRDEVRFTLERTESADGPEKILGELGLAHVAGRYPRDLSSGERQRAAVAAVLAGRPEIVLLDEPTRGMDSAARSSLEHVIGGLKAAGAAVVIATHDVELRHAVADRTLRVAGGAVA